MTKASSVAAGVRGDLRTLDPQVRRSGMAKMALALGALLDDEFRGVCADCQQARDIKVYVTGKDAAAIARELRATLLALREVGDDSAAGADLQARLSAPVGDAGNVRAAQFGAAGGGGRRAAGDAADAVAAPGRRRGAGG